MMQVIDWKPPSHAEGCSLAVLPQVTLEAENRHADPDYSTMPTPSTPATI